MILNKGLKSIQQRNSSLSTNGGRRLNPYISFYIKINSEEDQRPKCKIWGWKYSKWRGSTQDAVVCKAFSQGTPESEETKPRFNEGAQITVKDCTSKGINQHNEEKNYRIELYV